MDNQTLLIIVLGLISLAIFVIGFLFLLAWAGEQGFIGIAVFIACWVFMWPVMLGITGVVGLFLGVGMLIRFIKS